jgi:hypothetical protein
VKERRRSPRVPVEITIQIVGMKADASSSIAKPGRIVDANEHGALIECRTKFETDSDLMIQNTENFQSALAKVVRCQPGPGGMGWLLGVELLDSSMKDFLDQG